MKELIVFIGIFILSISLIHYQLDAGRYLENRRAENYQVGEESALDYHIKNGYNILNAMKRNQL